MTNKDNLSRAELQSATYYEDSKKEDSKKEDTTCLKS